MTARGGDPVDLETLLDRCGALPSAELTYPFGDDTAVFKIGGKIFAIVDLAGETGGITLKAEPDRVVALVREQPAVGPGYHMSKRHWVTVTLGQPIDPGLLDDLVEDSYDLVVASLPKRDRPLPDSRPS